jgi:hypothetical protein
LLLDLLSGVHSFLGHGAPLFHASIPPAFFCSPILDPTIGISGPGL